MMEGLLKMMMGMEMADTAVLNYVTETKMLI